MHMFVVENRLNSLIRINILILLGFQLKIPFFSSVFILFSSQKMEFFFHLVLLGGKKTHKKLSNIYLPLHLPSIPFGTELLKRPVLWARNRVRLFFCGKTLFQANTHTHTHTHR